MNVSVHCVLLCRCDTLDTVYIVQLLLILGHGVGDHCHLWHFIYVLYNQIESLILILQDF